MATPMPAFAPVDRPEVVGPADVIFPELDAVLAAMEVLPGGFRVVRKGPLFGVVVNVKSDSRYRS